MHNVVALQIPPLLQLDGQALATLELLRDRLVRCLELTLEPPQLDAKMPDRLRAIIAANDEYLDRECAVLDRAFRFADELLRTATRDDEISITVWGSCGTVETLLRGNMRGPHLRVHEIRLFRRDLSQTRIPLVMRFAS